MEKTHGSSSSFTPLRIQFWLFLLLILGLIHGCSKEESPLTSNQESVQTTQKPEVSVFTARKEKRSWPIHIQGTCIPRHEAVISAQIAATVEQIRVEEGDSVKIDDLLAVLDVREWKAQQNQAMSNLQSLKAQLEKLRAGFLDEEVRQAASRLDSSRATHRRLQKDELRQDRLFRAGMIREADYEDYLTRLSVAKADLDRASATYRLALRGFRNEEIKQMEAQVDGAQAALDLTGIRVGYGSIRSPLPGTISKRFVEPGEWVSPGTPLLTIQTLDPIWVEAFVPERDIAQVSKHIRAALQVQAFPGIEFEGKVDITGVQLDPSTRCLPIKIIVENPNNYLKSGMFARITLIPKPVPSLVIPKDAIFIENNREIVTLIHNERIKRVQITTGQRDGLFAEVRSNLSEGDRIVLSDIGGLEDGTEVTPVQAGLDSTGIAE